MSIPSYVASQWNLGPTFAAFLEQNAQYWQSQNPFPPPPVNFVGSGYGPVPTGGQDPETAANPFAACDPLGDIANAMSLYTNNYANNISSPVNSLIAEFQTQTAQVNELVTLPILKASNGILELSGANIKTTKKSSVKNSKTGPNTVLQLPQGITSQSLYSNAILSQVQSSSQTVPVNTMTTEDLFAALGVPFASGKDQTEDALIGKSIYVINGLWVKEGNLDVSCCKKLAQLLGGTDLCTKLAPYLSKPTGAYTFVITHKYQVVTPVSTQTACDPTPPRLPTGDCAPPEQVIDVEDVLAFDASVEAVLASFSFLKRENLFFYVFWNDVPLASQANVLSLQALGLTPGEVTAAVSVGTTTNLSSCVISKPGDILAYVCNVNDDSVIMKGPDGVDPDPDTDSIIDDIIAKALTPRPTTDTGIEDRDNVPAMVTGLIDLKKTFPCQGAAASDALNANMAQAAAAIDVGFDSANALLSSAQGAILGFGNGLSNLLTLVEQYQYNFPASSLTCLFPGQGFEISLPLPRSLLDAMQFTLNNQIATIESSLSVFDNLFSGLLAGFCIGTSLIQGLAPKEASSALASTGAISCASFELPLPQSLKDYLQCLLKIFQLVQRLLRAATSMLRNLFMTLQQLSLQFGFNVRHGLDTCAPVSVIGAISAIQAQLKALT